MVDISVSMKELTLDGTVAGGLREARYFMAMPEYVIQFKELLDIKPYPGTLNIKLDSDSLVSLELLRSQKGIRISGFERDGKHFGGVAAFRASLSGTECFVVIPDRTRYADVVEVISDKNLRKELQLKDDSSVQLVVRY